MKIKLDLIKEYVAELVASRINDIDIDVNAIANTTAISMISEIQCILKNQDFDDFAAIEEIVCVFEKHNIYCGNRHDFG